MIFAISLSAALLFGISDFSGGHATRTQPVRAVLFSSQLFGLLLITLLSPMVLSGVPATADLLWGAAAGLAGAVGIAFLYHGLAHTVVAVVSPTAALVGAVLPLIFGVLIGDGVGTSGWIGIFCILPAVVLLSYEHKHAPRTTPDKLKAFLFGFLAGSGFGLFFILIAQTTPAAGLWPLVSARLASLSLVLILSLLQRKPMIIHRDGFLPTLLAGILDMSANVAFMVAVQSGRIILVTAVTSAYPAATVLMARFIHKEPVHPLRWLGLAAAVVGVILMGVA